MKLTIYIEDVSFEHKTITDPKEIARVVKSHIAHLGKVKVKSGNKFMANLKELFK